MIEVTEVAKAQHIAETTARYMAAFLSQRRKSDNLKKQSKEYLERYAKVIGLELPPGISARSSSKARLIEHIVGWEINMIDIEEELTRLGIDFDLFSNLLPEI